MLDDDEITLTITVQVKVSAPRHITLEQAKETVCSYLRHTNDEFICDDESRLTVTAAEIVEEDTEPGNYAEIAAAYESASVTIEQLKKRVAELEEMVA